MNRHARRRTACQQRRQPTGYVHRLVAAHSHGALPRTGVRHMLIEHDYWCAYRGDDCSCLPNISSCCRTASSRST